MNEKEFKYISDLYKNIKVAERQKKALERTVENEIESFKFNDLVELVEDECIPDHDELLNILFDFINSQHNNLVYVVDKLKTQFNNIEISNKEELE